MKPQTKLILALALIIVPNIIGTILLFIDIDFLAIKEITTLQSRISGIGMIVGLSYMLSNTDFRKTIYQKLFYVCYAIMFVGMLAKLQHWSWASIALNLGVASILIIYMVRFFKKPIKLFPDYIKLLWFITFFISRYLFLQHNPLGEYVLILSLLLFITLLFYFIYHERKLKILEQEIETLDQRIV